MIDHKSSLFRIFISLCFIPVMVSCIPVKERKIQRGSIAYSETQQDGILHVNIVETLQDGTTCVADVKTGASIYQKYSLTPISENLILLSSSDIGYRIIKRISAGEWQIFIARRHDKGSATLYSACVGEITESGTMCNRIDLIYVKGEQV